MPSSTTATPEHTVPSKFYSECGQLLVPGIDALPSELLDAIKNPKWVLMGREKRTDPWDFQVEKTACGGDGEMLHHYAVARRRLVGYDSAARASILTDYKRYVDHNGSWEPSCSYSQYTSEYPDFQLGGRWGDRPSHKRSNKPKWKLFQMVPEWSLDLDISWKHREATRFLDGQYNLPVWANESWWIEAIKPGGVAENHFCHVSETDIKSVAYTLDDKKGEADRQTRTNPGKYLTKFFSDVLNGTEIGDWAAKHGAHFETLGLNFASTEEEIVRVYTQGPNSCMSHPASNWEHSIEGHPTRAYAGGDLQVAYFERDGNIAARTLCWPEKKVYSIIYGDRHRLEPLLKTAGYVRGKDDCFAGARLSIIPAKVDDASIVPWVDDNRSATLSDDGKHLVIDPEGPIPLQNTNGYQFTAPSLQDCPGCETTVQVFGRREHAHGWYRVRNRNNHRCCPSCIGRAVPSEVTGEHYLDTEVVSAINAWGDRFDVPLAELESGRISFVRCAFSGDWHATENTRPAPNGDRVADRHWHDYMQQDAAA